MNQNQNPMDDMPIISSYTREQAIEDGILVDLTKWAKETGFVFPVACTAAVWGQYIEPPDNVKSCQDVRGRAHDLLSMFFHAIRRSGGGADRLDFRVRLLQQPGRHELVNFKSICGPGDAGEPVITIMMPDED